MASRILLTRSCSGLGRQLARFPVLMRSVQSCAVSGAVLTSFRCLGSGAFSDSDYGVARGSARGPVRYDHRGVGP